MTSAPMTVGNHIIVGTGNDLDSPGYLMSFDPETGEQQWKFYTVPMNPGDPGLETWKSLDAARHGGGHPWLPGVYDPESHLYIFGTGNPTPAYTSKPRGEGLDNLFTCAIVAVQRRHRQDGVVLPDLAARHARLGLGADAGAGRRRLPRQRAAQAGADREPQRLLLHARSPHRRARGDEHVLRHRELGEAGTQREGATGSRSRRRTTTSPARWCRPPTAASTNWPPPAYSPDTGPVVRADRRKPTRCTT